MFSFIASIFTAIISITKELVTGLFFDAFLHIASNN